MRAALARREVRTLVIGKLWWSHVYRGASEVLVTKAADVKRYEFEAKAWTAA